MTRTGMTDTSTESMPLIGRRGFVGVLTGAGAAILAAVPAAGAGPTAGVVALPGETQRRTRRTSTLGTQFEDIDAMVGGHRTRVLVPHDAVDRIDAVWFHLGAGATVSRLDGALRIEAHRAVDRGMAVLCQDPGADAQTVERNVAAFAWAAAHFTVDRSVLHATGSGGVPAVAVLAERLLPRIAGLYLLDPPASLEFSGPAVFWSGRHVRAAGRVDAAALASIATTAAEASVAQGGDPAIDFLQTLDRWRAKTS